MARLLMKHVDVAQFLSVSVSFCQFLSSMLASTPRCGWLVKAISGWAKLHVRRGTTTGWPFALTAAPSEDRHGLQLERLLSTGPLEAYSSKY